MLEDLIAEAAERGFRINNLFQLDSGLWQANLRTRTHATQYGQGATPAAALDQALAVCTETFVLEEQTCVGHVDNSTLNLNDIMSLVTITKPKPNPFRGRL